MVWLTAAALMVLTPQDQAETKVFSDSDLGLTFQYPGTWVLTQERYATVLTIPLEDEKTATVQIFRSQFRQSAEDWQRIQSDVASSMGRVVDRQWEETILGVPVLMTRVLFQERGDRFGVVVGLFYTASPFKFNFRLTAPFEQLDSAERQWRDVILSLRTTSGELPQQEDPNRPLPTQTQQQSQPERPRNVNVLTPRANTRDPIRTENQVIATEGEDSYTIFLPLEFVLARREDGMYIEHASLPSSARLHIEVGAEDRARAFLNRAAGQSLSKFGAVELREDTPAAVNHAGAMVFRVFRKGTADGNPLWMLQASGSCDGVFWFAEFSGTEPMTKQQSDAVEALLRVLYVESTP